MSFPLMPFDGGATFLKSTSVVASSLSSGATIVVPATALSGDLLILVDAPYSLPGLTPAAPSGFTVLATIGFGFSGVLVSAKIADAASAGSTITGMDGNQDNGKILYVVRGDVAIQSFSAAKNLESTFTSGDPARQDAVATGVVSPAIVIGVAAEDQSGTVQWQNYGSTGTVPVFDSTQSPNAQVILGVSNVAFGASAFTQSVDKSDSGQNALGVFWLEVR